MGSCYLTVTDVVDYVGGMPATCAQRFLMKCHISGPSPSAGLHGPRFPNACMQRRIRDDAETLRCMIAKYGVRKYIVLQSTKVNNSTPQCISDVKAGIHGVFWSTFRAKEEPPLLNHRTCLHIVQILQCCAAC